MVDDEYVKQLEDVIKKMLAPWKDIPLKIVIKSLSGYDIIDFDRSDPNSIPILYTISLKSAFLVSPTSNATYPRILLTL